MYRSLTLHVFLFTAGKKNVLGVDLRGSESPSFQEKKHLNNNSCTICQYLSSQVQCVPLFMHTSLHFLCFTPHSHTSQISKYLFAHHEVAALETLH